MNSTSIEKVAEPCAPLKTRVVWAVAIIVVSLAFTYLIVRDSHFNGRLATIPNFDDISYLNDGANRLRIWQRQGLANMLQGYMASPSHSPVYSLMSLTTFAIFGFREAVPYAATAIWIIVLMLFANAVLAQARWWQRVMGFIIVLSMPFTACMIAEFRPDMACSMFTAIGAAWALKGRWSETSNRHRAAVGALFAAAMLIKPSVFLLTGFVFCVTLLTAFCIDFIEQERAANPGASFWCWLNPATYWRGKGRIGRILLSTWPAIVAYVLICLPHYWFTLDYLISYFKLGMYKDSDVWASHFGWRMHLRFYLDGDGGKTMLEKHLFIFSAMIAVGLWLGFRSKTRLISFHLFPIAGLTVMSYAIPTLNRIKSVYLGSNFYAFLLIGALIAFAEICRWLEDKRPLARICSLVPVLLCVVFFRMPLPHPNTGRGSYIAEERRRICGELYAELRRLMQDPANPAYSVYFTSVSNINAVAPFFYFYRDNLPAPNVLPTDMHYIPDQIHARINEADMIVGSEMHNSEVYEWMPNGKHQDEILGWLRADPTLRETARIKSNNPYHYVVFRRIKKAALNSREPNAGVPGDFVLPASIAALDSSNRSVRENHD